MAELFPGTRDFLDSYDRYGLVTARSVFAHNVHATDDELARMGETGAWVALGIGDRVGDFTVGKEFDAVLWRAPSGSDLAVNLANASDTTDALARVFALATPADFAAVWLRGQPVTRPNQPGRGSAADRTASPKS